MATRAELQAQLDDLDSQIAALDSQIAGLQSQENALGVQREAVQKQYDALPAKRTMLVGSSLYREPGEDQQAAYDRRVRNWGIAPETVRLYYTGLPWGAFPTFPGVPVASFKAPAAAFAGGDHDDAIRAFLESAAKNGRRKFVAFWHEPEDDIEAGAMTGVNYRAATAHLRDIIRSYAGSGLGLKSCQILMQWSLDPHSGRNVGNYLVDGLDAIGWDCYPGLDSGSISTDYQRCADATAAIGAPRWMLCETAPNSALHATQQQKADWLGLACQIARDKGCDLFQYFDSTVGGDFRLTSQAAWDAMAAEIRK